MCFKWYQYHDIIWYLFFFMLHVFRCVFFHLWKLLTGKYAASNTDPTGESWTSLYIWSSSSFESFALISWSGCEKKLGWLRDNQGWVQASCLYLGITGWFEVALASVCNYNSIHVWRGYLITCTKSKNCMKVDKYFKENVQHGYGSWCRNHKQIAFVKDLI